MDSLTDALGGHALLLLADAAQAAGLKVHMLGVGWSIATTPTPAYAVVAMSKLPASTEPRLAGFTLQLLDEDGRPVGPPGNGRTEVVGQIPVARPAGLLKPGALADANCVFNIPPMPLQPGRYTWQFEVDGGIVANTSFEVIATRG